MYCDKPHVNQLTALLKRHGFQDIVVCPGSRNGILVHNFNEAGFHLHPVTDERSAAFVTLGLCLSTQRPVAICVTSGSALLNTIPAVAEAAFRQIPLLVISADRPKQWINQLDGQTLSQNQALEPYAPSFAIEEFHSPEEERWNNLRINEALLQLHHHGGQPIHINVPITEPLFSFHTEALPSERVITEDFPETAHCLSSRIMQEIQEAQFPVIVIGQYEKGIIDGLSRIEEKGTLLILPELVSQQEGCWRTTALEHLLPDFDFHPDLVIHMGGNLVNKQLKLYLRKLDCKVIRIEPTEFMPDTFGHLHTIIHAEPDMAVRDLCQLQQEKTTVREAQTLLDEFRNYGQKYNPLHFSDLAITQLLSRNIRQTDALQIANSSVIRNATYFFDSQTHFINCNRGVNGIEGSLSAAVGYAMGHPHLTFSLIGDLSFFYDQNALWNKQLPANLRIVMFNNGGGQIFYRLPGLRETSALSPYIAASHHTEARGLAENYGITYLEAHNQQQVLSALQVLLTEESGSPILLEVFTQTEDNETELKNIKQYYKTLSRYGKNLE